jgi:four helix bundle protein
MGKIEKFEDMDVWKKARELVNEIYKLTSGNLFKKDYTLKDQINRAAISIMLNIAEGFGRKSNKEFILFLGYAHGSIAEVQSALYIAEDRKYLTEEQFKNIYEKCTQISKSLMGFIKYLKK